MENKIVIIRPGKLFGTDKYVFQIGLKDSTVDIICPEELKKRHEFVRGSFELGPDDHAQTDIQLMAEMVAFLVKARGKYLREQLEGDSIYHQLGKSLNGTETLDSFGQLNRERMSMIQFFIEYDFPSQTVIKKMSPNFKTSSIPQNLETVMPLSLDEMSSFVGSLQIYCKRIERIVIESEKATT
ncbi:MAG: hypothetical protein KBD26_01955 [Candidatus Pacebacteria bacterium]|nr:hypothetical protein [Candidatus Paceibacterota bacterium]MBP9772575.1 hypothetical protein [Candidatus Paceibacterota bacterium]